MRHVPHRNVFSRDTKQAPHLCLLSLRWLWQSLTRQRAPLQNGQTPLHLAANAKKGGEEVIGLLLEAGADREAKDNVSGDRGGGRGGGSGERGGQEETRVEARGMGLAG